MKLYIVATPIGNLEDISFRAIRILNEVDLVLCEDTRVTKILLERYEIKKPILSYHQHSKLQKIDYIINLLKEGKNLALVSDAGTPGISDPGQRLIGKVLEELGGEIKIEPIPGPNAAIAALSISGFDTDEFLFLGFPPHKKGRQTFFVNILEESQKRTVVFYESTHRIIKALEQGINKEIRNNLPRNAKRSSGKIERWYNKRRVCGDYKIKY
ncbi:MAG: Ribosomal RNA small subunit methyltransferase I [Parcubacteria group bacterium GW2011_GWC1_38_17]|nr:MAG: Ribosomal RNA small subunit methyltransferase I [Parcubacteria group bacterium GW2011_GWC1_38_17]